MKPTEEMLARYVFDMQQFYAKRNENMLAWRSLYFLQEESTFFDDNGRKIEKRPDEVRVISSLPFSICEGFRTLLMAKHPILSVPYTNVRNIDKTLAQSNENLLYVLWYAGNVYQEVVDAIWHALVDGWGCLLTYYDEKARDDESPVIVRSVDPRFVYPAPGKRRGEWKYVLTIENRLVSEVKDEFAVEDNRTKAARLLADAVAGYRDTDTVQLVTYYDDEYYAIGIGRVSMATGVSSLAPVGPIRWIQPPVPHNYGKQPFTIFFGERLPFRDEGRRMGISILYPVEDLLRYLNRLLSQKATIIARFADPAKVSKTAGGQGVDWDNKEGIALSVDEDVFYLEHRGPQPQIDAQIEIILQMIESSTLPRHMYGSYVGRLSGVSMSLLRTPVLMKVAFKQEELEKALVNVNEIMLRIVDKVITKPYLVYGKGTKDMLELQITPGMVNGYYRNVVKLSTSLPTDEPQIVTMLAALLQLNILGSQTVRDVIQNTLGDLVPQDLQQEEDEILIDKYFRNNPMFGNAIALMAAEKAGLDVVGLLGKLQQFQSLLSGGRGEAQSIVNAGTIPQSPLNQIQSTQPSAADRLKALIQQLQFQQGGTTESYPTPAASQGVESPGTSLYTRGQERQP